MQERTVALKEISITQSRVIRKADRWVILPSEQQINSSMNGLDLFDKMNKFHLWVDKNKETITYGANQYVQVRINGMKASAKDVATLLPQQVLKVEYYEHPGKKFGGEGAKGVLNFIVKHVDGGGAASLSLTDGLSAGTGNNRASIKLNKKNQSFRLITYLHSKNISIDGMTRR